MTKCVGISAFREVSRLEKLRIQFQISVLRASRLVIINFFTVFMAVFRGNFESYKFLYKYRVFLNLGHD